MIKKTALIILIAACLLFTSCITTTEQVETEHHTEWYQFEVIGYYGSYTIYAHKQTGVCYLQYNSTYRCALTVMLNADGTPVTIDQIKGE